MQRCRQLLECAMIPQKSFVKWSKIFAITTFLKVKVEVEAEIEAEYSVI